MEQPPSETGECDDEREEQKQENGLIDLIWILLSAVRVMMMMRVPLRIPTLPLAYATVYEADKHC